MRKYKFNVHFHDGKVVRVDATHFDHAVIKACNEHDNNSLPEHIEREDGSSYSLKMIKVT